MRIYCRSRTSQPQPSHRVFPYLMRGLSIERPHQVWCADTTYIPLQRGFLYLSVAVPHYVAPEEIETLIASCDASTVISGQDRAVLPLLARLSLRPGDLTAVRLADIDWEQALLTVSGQARSVAGKRCHFRRTSAMPLRTTSCVPVRAPQTQRSSCALRPPRRPVQLSGWIHRATGDATARYRPQRPPGRIPFRARPPLYCRHDPGLHTRSLGGLSCFTTPDPPLRPDPSGGLEPGPRRIRSATRARR